MILPLFFVSCFGWYRDYIAYECTACPASLYQDCKTGWYQCDKSTQGGKESACGFANAGCHIHCCRDEQDLCTLVKGNLNSGSQEHIDTGLSESECADACALQNWDGIKMTEQKCYCLKDIGSLDPSKDYWKSCEFVNLPAYRTQDRMECSDDNGQILVEKQCRYQLPKDEATFGVFADTVSWSTKPYGCIVEAGNRYWNTDWHSETMPKDDTFLICRGGPPLSVSKGKSTGQCPEGQRLNEHECQYQVEGYGTWDTAWKDEDNESCGCYIQQGDRRIFNRAQGACDSPDSDEEMVCKKIVPKELCQYIVDEVQGTESGGETPRSVEYLGQTIHIGWNVVKWDPTMECVTTEQILVVGPIKCESPESCPVSYTYTESETTGWTTSNGASVNAGAEMEFEAGIPLIFEIDAGVEAGLEYDYKIDKTGSHTIESSWEATASCKNFDLRTSCYVFTTMNTFNTTAEAGPQFYLLEEGQTEQSFIDCEKEFGITTRIAWEAQTGQGYEARGIPNCKDTEGACNNLDFGDCNTNDYTQMQCPESCGVFGLGPAACPDGAACGFTPVEKSECPPPPDLDKEGEPFIDCLDCFNGKPQPCQARIAFPAGSGPDDWNIQNCQDDHGYYYNIFRYSCDIKEQEDKNAKLQEHYKSLEPAKLEAKLAANVPAPLQVAEEVVGNKFVIEGLAFIGVLSIVGALVRICLRSNKSEYVDIEQEQSEAEI